MNKHARYASLALIVAVLACTGCAGAGHTLKMDQLRYPTSMSGYIYGPEYELLWKRHLEELGPVNVEKKIWAMAWGKGDLNGESANAELVEAVNAEVEKLGGEGIINFKISSESCGMNFVPALSMLPFWAGCAVVRAEGTVVRRKDVPESDAAPASPPDAPPAADAAPQPAE